MVEKLSREELVELVGLPSEPTVDEIVDLANCFEPVRNIKNE